MQEESQQLLDEPEITASWSTVDEQRALVAESSRTKEAWWMKPKLELVIHPAWGYRSNAVTDPWWPSYFLPEDTVRDAEEAMPILS